jgi:hypothetical protein
MRFFSSASTTTDAALGSDPRASRDTSRTHVSNRSRPPGQARGKPGVRVGKEPYEVCRETLA